MMITRNVPSAELNGLPECDAPMTVFMAACGAPVMGGSPGFVFIGFLFYSGYVHCSVSVWAIHFGGQSVISIFRSLHPLTEHL